MMKPTLLAIFIIGLILQVRATIAPTHTPTAPTLPTTHFGPNENLVVDFNLLVTGNIAASKKFLIRLSPPTAAPSKVPTLQPSAGPSISPTPLPGFLTTTEPTSVTDITTQAPSGTRLPSKAPTTRKPTKTITKSPTQKTLRPTLTPTFGPLTVIIAKIDAEEPLLNTQMVNSQGQTVDVPPNFVIDQDTEFVTNVVLENPNLADFPLTPELLFSWCLKTEEDQVSCSEDSLKFFTVEVNLVVSSIIANPVAFTYELDDGQVYAKGSLTPDPIVKLFNVLESSLAFTVSKVCQENPSLSNQPWLQLGVVEGLVPAQSGAPKEIDFSINLTASSLPVDANDPFLEKPAAILKGCLEVVGVLRAKDVLQNQSLNTPVFIDISASRICPKGAFSADRGRDGRQGCQRCPIGTFQNQAGQVSCTPCSGFTTTLEPAARSSNECVALLGYFYDSIAKSIEICPPWADCTVPALTLETLPLKNEMWRTAAISNDTKLCPRVTRHYCIGGVNETAKSLGQLGLVNEDVVFNATGAYCAKYHAGAYCVACIENAAKRTGPNGFCEPCTSELVVADQLAFVGGIFLALLGLIFIVFMVAIVMSIDEIKSKKILCGFCYDLEKQPGTPQTPNGQAKRSHNLLFLVDFGNTAIRILLGYIQVVFIMGKTFENQLPEFLTSPFFSFLSFSPPNLITVGCVLPTANHYSKLLFATVAPLGCLFLMLIVYAVLRCRLKSISLCKPNQFGCLCRTACGCGERGSFFSGIFAWTRNRRELDTRFRSLLLFFLFLIYPTTSSSILGTFTCDFNFDDGSSFLAVDYSVQCYTPTYYSYFIYSIVMTILYVVGIPFYFSFILFRSKVVGYFRSVVVEEESQLLKRGEDEGGRDAGVGSSKFLWRPYKNEWYFWEVLELIRKLLQTSVLVLVSPGSPLQVVYLLIVTVFMVSIISTISPYSDSDSTNIAVVCQFSILYISFACLLASLDPLGQKFDLVAIQITVAGAFGMVYAFVLYVVVRRMCFPKFHLMNSTGSLANSMLTGFFEALAKATMNTRHRIVSLCKVIQGSHSRVRTASLSAQLLLALILAIPMVILVTGVNCIESIRSYYKARGVATTQNSQSVERGDLVEIVNIQQLYESKTSSETWANESDEEDERGEPFYAHQDTKQQDALKPEVPISFTFPNIRFDDDSITSDSHRKASVSSNEDEVKEYHTHNVVSLVANNPPLSLSMVPKNFVQDKPPSSSRKRKFVPRIKESILERLQRTKPQERDSSTYDPGFELNDGGVSDTPMPLGDPIINFKMDFEEEEEMEEEETIEDNDVFVFNENVKANHWPELFHVSGQKVHGSEAGLEVDYESDTDHSVLEEVVTPNIQPPLPIQLNFALLEKSPPAEIFPEPISARYVESEDGDDEAVSTTQQHDVWPLQHEQTFQLSPPLLSRVNEVPLPQRATSWRRPSITNVRASFSRTFQRQNSQRQQSDPDEKANTAHEELSDPEYQEWLQRFQTTDSYPEEEIESDEEI